MKNRQCCTVMFLAACTFLLSMALAQPSPQGDPSKKPIAAISDVRKAYIQQLTWARAQFDQAVKAAKEKQDAADREAKADYLVALRKALRSAMAAQKLQEANAIDAEIKLIEAEIRPMVVQTKPKPNDSDRSEVTDKKLAELIVSKRWLLDYRSPSTNGRRLVAWTFDANGTLSDTSQPNWWIRDGELVTCRLSNRWRYNSEAGRWESILNKADNPDNAAYIWPQDAQRPR